MWYSDVVGNTVGENSQHLLPNTYVFSLLAKRLDGKSIPKMINFVSSEMLNFEEFSSSVIINNYLIYNMSSSIHPKAWDVI